MGSGWHEDLSCNFVTAPIDLAGRPARVAVNVEGLGARGQVRVEVLDEQLRPLPGHEPSRCRDLGNGFCQPVSWGDVDVVDTDAGRIRLRVHIEGVRPEDVKLYAVYLESFSS